MLLPICGLGLQRLDRWRVQRHGHLHRDRHWRHDGDSDLHRIEEVIHRVLDTLEPRQKEILSSRFGLNGLQPQTLEQIAPKYALTRERIRQIERGALERLRHPCRVEILKKL